MWLELLHNTVGAFLGAGIVTAILGYWFEERRRKEIKKEEAVEAVADFLAEWIKPSYIGSAQEENEARWKLQSLYWKTILRLDKKILDVLIPRLANAENCVPSSQIIVEIRKVLLNLKKPDLKAEDLNTWLPKGSSDSGA